jgi:hypothetical protein
MDRDFMPAIIVSIFLAALAIISALLWGPDMPDSGCYLSVRPRHDVGSLPGQASPLPINSSHCISR